MLKMGLKPILAKTSVQLCPRIPLCSISNNPCPLLLRHWPQHTLQNIFIIPTECQNFVETPHWPLSDLWMSTEKPPGLFILALLPCTHISFQKSGHADMMSLCWFQDDQIKHFLKKKSVWPSSKLGSTVWYPNPHSCSDVDQSHCNRCDNLTYFWMTIGFWTQDMLSF